MTNLDVTRLALLDPYFVSISDRAVRRGSWGP